MYDMWYNHPFDEDNSLGSCVNICYNFLNTKDVTWLCETSRILPPTEFLQYCFPNQKTTPPLVSRLKKQSSKDRKCKKSPPKVDTYLELTKKLNKICRRHRRLDGRTLQFFDTHESLSSIGSLDTQLTLDVMGFFTDPSKHQKGAPKHGWCLPIEVKTNYLEKCCLIIEESLKRKTCVEGATSPNELNWNQQSYFHGLCNFAVFAWSRAPCRYVFLGAYCPETVTIRFARLSPNGMIISQPLHLNDVILPYILKNISTNSGLEFDPEGIFKPVTGSHPDTLNRLAQIRDFWYKNSGDSVWNSHYQDILETPQNVCATFRLKDLKGHEQRTGSEDSKITKQKGVLEEKEYTIFMVPIAASWSLFGRGSRCYLAIESAVLEEETFNMDTIPENLVALKVSWPHDFCPLEGEFYKKVHGNPEEPDVKNVARMIDEGIVPGTRANESAATINVRPDIARGEREMRYLLLKDVGVPLSRLENPDELLMAMKDMIEAVHSCRKRGVIHRDISLHNVLINIKDRSGLLIDLDMAIREEDTPVTILNSSLTGTPRFASIARYDTFEMHQYWHDLESIYWVHVYCVIRFFRGIKIADGGHFGVDRDNREAILKYYFNDSDLLSLAYAKRNFLAKCVFPPRDERYSAHAKLLNKLRSFWTEFYREYWSLKHLEIEVGHIESQEKIESNPEDFLDGTEPSQECAGDMWRTRRQILQKKMERLQAVVAEDDYSFKLAQKDLNKLSESLPMRRPPSETDFLPLYEHALQVDKPEKNASNESSPIKPQVLIPSTGCLPESQAPKETHQQQEELKSNSHGLKRKEPPGSISSDTSGKRPRFGE